MGFKNKRAKANGSKNLKSGLFAISTKENIKENTPKQQLYQKVYQQLNKITPYSEAALLPL